VLSRGPGLGSLSTKKREGGEGTTGTTPFTSAIAVMSGRRKKGKKEGP